MTNMTLMPLFASNLILINLDEKFNYIDKDKIIFNLSTLGKNQNTDISSSMYVLDDYLELGHHILDIFHEYTFNTLKLKNNQENEGGIKDAEIELIATDPVDTEAPGN